MLDQLDRFDKAILFEMDLNARLTYAELGRKVRLGSDLVRYRVEKMVASGLIGRFSAVVDVHQIGMTVFKLYLKVSPDAERRKELLQYLNRAQRTHWLTEFYGNWDILVCQCALHVREFKECLNRLYSKFGEDILDSDISTLVEVERYPKKYLTGKAANGSLSGHIRRVADLDDLEINLLALLMENARYSYVELADRLDSTPSVIEYRLSKLQQQEIIRGYRVQLDYNRCGIQVFKVQAFPHRFDPSEERRFRDYCRKHLLITCHILQVGHSPLEFEVEVSNYADFHKVIDEIRAQFPSYIRSLEHLLIKEDHFHRLALNFRQLGERTLCA